MSDFNKITDILKTMNCLCYMVDEESCSIINTSNSANTYQSTKELIAVRDLLNNQSINYTVDENMNFIME